MPTLHTTASTPSKTRTLIFGTGNASTGIESECAERGLEIVGYIDNSPGKIGKSRMGKPISHPSIVQQHAFDLVVTASASHEAMKSQLLELGVQEEKIISARPTPSKWFSQEILSYFKHTLGEDAETLRTEKLSFPIEGKETNNIPRPTSESDDNALVERIFKAYCAAKNNLAQAPDCYRPGENWHHFLTTSRPNFYQAIESGDTDTLRSLLNNFARNELSSGILGGEEGFNAFINTSSTTDLVEYFSIWAHSIGDAPIHEVASPPIGNPYGYRVDGHTIIPNSFLNHYRASMLHQLIPLSSEITIAEIGGGFGGLGYSLLQRNDKTKYLNFDLPENLVVSAYYLGSLFPEKRIYLYDGANDIQEKLDDYDIFLLPNFSLAHFDRRTIDIFVNTISFSEMDYASIVEYLRKINEVTKHYFYQENLLHNRMQYKYYPTSTFPELSNFRRIYKSPSRWPFFSVNSHCHVHGEELFINTQK
ncbi:MAG: hypothetical protein RIR18_1681 [Pseudomonadota bacterium]|jgi:putative sugar O-methyltransferase